jgi:hypothetical protein
MQSDFDGFTEQAWQVPPESNEQTGHFEGLDSHETVPHDNSRKRFGDVILTEIFPLPFHP